MWSPTPRSPTCRGLNLLWIIAASVVTVTLWSGSIANVHGAPAKLDAKVTPFPLELQAPQFADAVGAAVVGDNGASSFSSKPSAVDSYGNPIEALKPIDTPDGRKVVSAQGLQFEIPNYASGITELKQPSDDLLPPFIDPIAVAVPNESAEGVTAANAGTTTVHVESAQLVELKPQQQQQQQQLHQESSHSPNVISADSKELPSYLLDLNDPNIGGPVDYAPLDDGSALKVIAWDLLPPLDAEPQIITADNNTPKRVIGVEDPKTHNIKFSLTSSLNGPSTVPQRSGITTEASDELNGPIDAENPHSNRGSQHRTGDSGLRQSVAGVESSNEQAETPNKVTANQYHSRGNVHYTSTTTTTTAPRTNRPTTTTTTTSRPTTTSTTTSRPTTTTTTRSTTTTTTRRPTTTTPRRPITTTTTAAPLNPADFYQLEHGDSYTLPSWLAGIDDPDLDAAVGYVVPDDINEYNHTLDRDLVPPLEPFTDLNIINLAAPADQHTTAQPTLATFTTTSTTTKRTTTTRRPTVSTSKPHWVRAHSTAATSTSTTSTTTTTPKPISPNTHFTPNQFAPLEDITSAASPPKSDTNTVSSTSTTTTTTTQKPRTATPSHQFSSFNAFNQNIPTTITAPLDNGTAVGEQNPEFTRGTNPFLPIRNTGPNRPKPFTATGAGRPIATEFTTTTTTTATPVDDNPFNTATTPPWLADFDYPELGPGVPYVLDTTEVNSAVANNLQPPSQLEAGATDTSKPVFVTSSPTSFNSFQAPPSFAHQPNTFASSSGSFSSNFPSKVTIPTTTSTTPHPFTKTGQQANDIAFKQLPVFFTPPTAVAESEVPSVEASQINTNVNPNNVNANNNPQLPHAELAKKTPSSSFNKHFAAPFEPSAPASVGLSTPSVDQEVGGSTKTTFTKSNDGKVISSNVLPQGAIISPTPAKPFGFGNSLSATQPQQKDLQAPRPNQFVGSSTDFSGTFNKGATPSGFSSFASSTFSSSSSSTFGSSSATTGAGKYTGTFGGAPGVLGSGRIGYAVQADGSIRDPTQAYSPTAATAAAAPFVPAPTVASKPAFGGFGNPVATAATSTRSGASVHKYKFGGPPGILVPYDNIKGGKP